MPKKKYFTKILIAYAALIVIFTVVVAYTFFYKSMETYKIEIDNSQKIILNQISQRVDNKLVTAIYLMDQLKSSEVLTNYLSSSGIDLYKIARVKEELKKNLSAFSSLGYSIAVSKVRDNFVVTMNEAADLQEYFAEMGIENANMEYFVKNFEKEDAIVPYFTVNTEKGYLIMVRKGSASREIQFVEIFVFDESEFFPDKSLLQNGALVIMRKDEIISVTSDLDTESVKKMLDKHTLELLKDPGEETVRLQLPQYSIMAAASSVLDWKYIYITSDSKAAQYIKPLVMDSLKLYGLLFLLGLIAAYLLSRNLYRPVYEMLNKFREFGGGSNENLDEFLYIEKTVSKIKKDYENLVEVINHHRIPLKIKFLRDLLNGLIPKHEIEAQAKAVGVKLFEHELGLTAIEFSNYKYMEGEFSKEAVFEIKARILSILEQELRSYGDFEVIEMNYKRYVVLKPGEMDEKFRTSLGNIIDSIRSNFGIEMVAVIGRNGTTPHNVEDAYSDIQNTLENRFALGKKTIITDEDVSSLKLFSYYYPMDMERELIYHVLSGKEREAAEILCKIVEENFEKRTLSKDVKNQLVFALAATVNRILQKINKSEAELFDGDRLVFLELKMAQSKEEFDKKLGEIFGCLMKGVHTAREGVERNISKEIFEYIHQNYNRDISLGDLASQFGFSVVYMSTFFKTITGDNFKDYLNRYRVEIAKEIIKKEDISINELAKVVGFNSADTFIRVFKRYEEISPGQYSVKWKK